MAGRIVLLREVENPTWEDKFAIAFFDCLDDGVHPGPTEINKRLGRTGRLNQLNGRESRLRIRLMHDNNVPYKRHGAFGVAGQVPQHTDSGPQF